MTGKDEDQPEIAVDGFEGDTDGSQKVGDHTVTAEQDDPHKGTDKGREHEGKRAQGDDQSFSGNVPSGYDKGQRYAHEDCGDGRCQAHEHAVEKASPIGSVGRKVLIILQRKGARFLCLKAPLHDPGNGYDEEKDEYDNDQDRCKSPEGRLHRGL